MQEAAVAPDGSVGRCYVLADVHIASRRADPFKPTSSYLVDRDRRHFTVSCGERCILTA